MCIYSNIQSYTVVNKLDILSTVPTLAQCAKIAKQLRNLNITN